MTCMSLNPFLLIQMFVSAQSGRRHASSADLKWHPKEHSEQTTIEVPIHTLFALLHVSPARLVARLDNALAQSVRIPLHSMQ
jgi:hypothetical protein